MEDIMFKTGDKVRCIDKKALASSDLTLGKVYTVESVTEDSVVILDDNEDIWEYSSSRFELVNEVNTFEFQLDDIVEFGGLEGKVNHISEPMNSIQVTFETGSDYYFTVDGRFHTYHTKPLLNLVSRPKKKEKRIVKTTVQYSPSLDAVFTGLEVTQPDDLIVVTLEKEIEVEV